MTWNPDWNSLNTIAGSFLASTPLAAQIESVTPPGGKVVSGLYVKLADVLADAADASQLLVAVDTLVLPAGEVTIAATGIGLVARSLVVEGGGASTLRMSAIGAGVSLTISEVTGTVQVAFGTEDPSTLPALTALAETFTMSASAPTPTMASDTQSLADTFHEPWNVLSLDVTSALAGVIIDYGEDAAIMLGASMQAWVSHACSCLLRYQSTYSSSVDYNDIASLATAAASSLTFTQTAASGASYAPILQASSYQDQVNALLGLAEIYDTKIAAFEAQEQQDELLAQFASTLSDVAEQSTAPLKTKLTNLANQTGLLESQLLNAATQLAQVGDQLPKLAKNLEDAIEAERERQLVTQALTMFTQVITIYISLGAAAIDPALATTSFRQVQWVLTALEKTISAGAGSVTSAIANGIQAAGGTVDTNNIQLSQRGAEALGGSLMTLGRQLYVFWAVVDQAVKNDLNLDPDFLSSVTAAPDLSAMSTGGLDPAIYWETVVAQCENAVKPLQNLPQAAAYLEALEIGAAYGSSVADLQQKLLDLYVDAVETFMSLQAAYKAQASWTSLQDSLQSKEAKAKAAVGLLDRSYLNIKRQIVAAVRNYRAAFLYQWLEPASVNVDVTMDYATLERFANNSIASLQDVLSGHATGTIKPRQDFTGVRVTLTPAFDGNVAHFSLTPEASGLPAQLAGSTAIYLTEAEFILVGVDSKDDIQLRVSTSGAYINKLNGETYRFVSQGVEMLCIYTPGVPPTFKTKWKFADPAAYMAPTPYAGWTVEVVQGDVSAVQGLELTLSGLFLQNG